MGWYFRKSKSFGPLRINLSKSGIGLSTGVKGARVSVGPRGTYLNMGRNGLYYRKKLDGRKTKSQGIDTSKNINDSPINNQYTYNDSSSNSAQSMYVEDSGSSLGREIIKKIWISRITLCLLGLLSILMLFPFKYAGIFLAGGLLIVWHLFFRAKLEYELDEKSFSEWENFLGWLSYLQNCNRLWLIENELYNTNKRVNAGSTSSVDRSNANIVFLKQNGKTGLNIRTNVHSAVINTKNCQLLFLPNGIVIKKGAKLFSYSYELINLSVSMVNFVETEYIANDTEIVKYTWLYVNRDGTPDRRYNNNRQLPVCRYGVVQIYGANLSIELETSNARVVDNIGIAYQNYRLYLSNSNNIKNEESYDDALHQHPIIPGPSVTEETNSCILESPDEDFGFKPIDTSEKRIVVPPSTDNTDGVKKESNPVDDLFDYFDEV